MQPANKPKIDVMGSLNRWAAGIDQDVRQFFVQMRYKLTHLPQTNYELGLRFAASGKLRDAILRFKVTLYFAPDFTIAWYHLARCYVATGESEKAVQALKKTLSLDPMHTDAKYVMATIDARHLIPQDRPQKMPAHMMEEFFTSVAIDYDVMEHKAGYQLPQNCYKLLRTKTSGAGLRILDVGCGTGLASALWRKDARLLVGVDVVGAMAERARMARIEGAPIFDSVLTADAGAQGLTLAQAPFDLVLLINVLAYAGAPSAMIKNAVSMMDERAHLVITIEPYAGTDGFGVVAATSRFGHSLEYVTRVASEAGLQIIEQAQVNMYEGTKVTLMVFSRAKAAL